MVPGAANSRFAGRLFCHDKTLVAVAHLRETFPKAPELSTKEGDGLFHLYSPSRDDAVL